MRYQINLTTKAAPLCKLDNFHWNPRYFRRHNFNGPQSRALNLNSQASQPPKLSAQRLWRAANAITRELMDWIRCVCSFKSTACSLSSARGSKGSPESPVRCVRVQRRSLNWSWGGWRIGSRVCLIAATRGGPPVESLKPLVHLPNKIKQRHQRSTPRQRNFKQSIKTLKAASPCINPCVHMCAAVYGTRAYPTSPNCFLLCVYYPLAKTN